MAENFTYFRLVRFPLIFLFIFFLVTGYGQNNRADSLKSELKKSAADTNRLRLLTQLTKEYFVQNADVCTTYARQGIVLYDSLMKINGNIPAQVAANRKYGSSCYHNLAAIISRSGNFGDAIYYQKISLGIRDTLLKTQKGDAETIRSIAISCSNLATYYQQIGDYGKAQTFAERSLNCYDSTLMLIPGDVKTRDGRAKAIVLLGNVNMQQDDLDKAVEYFNQALVEYESTGNKDGVSGTLFNLGTVTERQGNFDEAFRSYDRAQESFENQNSLDNAAMVLDHKGELNLKLGNLQAARENFNKALEYGIVVNDKAVLAKSHHRLGKVDFLERKYGDAQAHEELAMQLAIECGKKKLQSDIYKLLGDIYAEQGDHRKSAEAFRMYANLKDTLFDVDRNRQLSDAMTKYNSELKEQQNEALRKDNALNQAEIERQREVRNLTFGIGALIVIIALMLSLAYRQKRNANIQLTSLNAEISSQKSIIEMKQKETTDSIHYARKIQGALFAAGEVLSAGLKDYLLFFQPKDIVSGDFYWAAAKHNGFYLAVCDSTGHGVPGAFMSLLNISYLNEAVNEKGIAEPGKVLDHVRSRLMENVGSSNQKDGMDGVLVWFDRLTNRMQFSAAYNSPVIIRNGEVIHFDADKMPVGPFEQIRPFTTQTVQLQIGDCVFLSTDGFADQFGGAKGKKFRQRQLVELFLHIGNTNSELNNELISKRFTEWKGDLEQIDDVLVLAFRVT